MEGLSSLDIRSIVYVFSYDVGEMRLEMRCIARTVRCIFWSQQSLARHVVTQKP